MNYLPSFILSERDNRLDDDVPILKNNKETVRATPSLPVRNEKSNWRNIEPKLFQKRTAKNNNVSTKQE